MNTLIQKQVWSITYTSRDDGTRLTQSYFTNYSNANKVNKRVVFGEDQAIVSVNLWTDGQKWYKIDPQEVFIDIPDRQEVLQKLSYEEKIALGITV